MTSQEIIDIGNDPRFTKEAIDAAALELAHLGRSDPLEGERVWAAIYNPGQGRIEAAFLRWRQRQGEQPWGQ
jgi:hypothetical protein